MILFQNIDANLETKRERAKHQTILDLGSETGQRRISKHIGPQGSLMPSPYSRIVPPLRAQVRRHSRNPQPTATPSLTPENPRAAFVVLQISIACLKRSHQNKHRNQPWHPPQPENPRNVFAVLRILLNCLKAANFDINHTPIFLTINGDQTSKIIELHSLCCCSKRLRSKPPPESTSLFSPSHSGNPSPLHALHHLNIFNIQIKESNKCFQIF